MLIIGILIFITCLFGTVIAGVFYYRRTINSDRTDGNRITDCIDRVETSSELIDESTDRVERVSRTLHEIAEEIRANQRIK